LTQSQSSFGQFGGTLLQLMKHHLSSTIVCPPCATQYVVLFGSSVSGAIASSES